MFRLLNEKEKASAKKFVSSYCKLLDNDSADARWALKALYPFFLLTMLALYLDAFHGFHASVAGEARPWIECPRCRKEHPLSRSGSEVTYRCHGKVYPMVLGDKVEWRRVR